MKKYGLVLLLLIFSRSVFAEGCYFYLNRAPSIHLTLNGIKPISLGKNTNGQQLVATYTTTNSEVLTSHYSETEQSMSLTVVDGDLSTRTTKLANGAVLFPVFATDVPAAQTGYGFAFKVNGPYSAYVQETVSYAESRAGGGVLFPNLTKEQCEGQNWTFTVELWHVDNYLKDERKFSALTPPAYQSTYFRLYFPGENGNDSLAYIGLIPGISIPVTQTTCDLSVNSNMIDFGNLYLRDPDSWPTKEVILTSNNCSQVGTAQLRILSNGHRYSSKVLALGNQLTGDNAAKDILVRFTTKSGASINLDTSESDNGLSCDTDTLSFASDGFISSCTHTVIANIYPLSGGEATTGDFETSATFSVTYY